MTGPELRAAREHVSRALGDKISWSDMAALCGLADPGGNGKATVKKWEEGYGPSGPVGTLLGIVVEGLGHVSGDVHGFFVNWVRERIGAD